MLAVSAAALGVGASLAHVVDSVSGVNRKPTPVILLPVDGCVTTTLRPDVGESWLSEGTRPESGRRPATVTTRVKDDASYRYKRLRNNEAARRSREKRRNQDGVIRRQLDALAAENRELRCQLALFRRLLDEVVGGTYHKDGSGSVLQPGRSTSSICSSVALSPGSDPDGESSSSVDDVTMTAAVGGEEDGSSCSSRDEVESSTSSESVDRVRLTDADWQQQQQQQQAMTPLNLSRRPDSS